MKIPMTEQEFYMNAETERLNDRIDLLTKAMSNLADTCKIQSERIDTANKRIDNIYKSLTS